MNIKYLISSLAFGALLASSSLAQAAIVPFDFTHHGVLWDGDKLANGRTDIEAVLYDVSGQNPVKIKSVRTYVEVDNGYYAVTIPDIDPQKVLDAKGHLSFQLFIADQPLEPMIPISSVPFAMIANRADSARVADAATDVLCEGCVNYDNMAEDIQKVLDSADSDGKIKVLANNVVSENIIQASAVTTAKLADDVHYALSDKKGGAALAIAANTVSSGNIVDGEVRTDDIHDKNVTLEKLSDGVQASLAKADKSITTGNDTVTSAMIVDGAVATADLANGSVTKAKLSGIYAAQVFGTIDLKYKCDSTCSGYGTSGGCSYTCTPTITFSNLVGGTMTNKVINFTNSISNPVVVGFQGTITSTSFTPSIQWGQCTYSTTTSNGTTTQTGACNNYTTGFAIFGSNQ